MIQASIHEEVLQCFDDQRKPTEGRLRSEVKIMPYRWWYGVSHIWVVNHEGQLLCSKRSETLSGNPGKWQSYFGGHVPFGLSFEETAVKELQEEVGLNISSLDLFFVEDSLHEGRKQFCKSFALLFNGNISDVSFPDAEVVDAKWMKMDEYWNEQERNPERWCNRCFPKHQKIILEWLASQYLTARD